jgi:hypothetical protein
LLVEQLAGNRALIGRPFRPDDEGQVTIPTPSPNQSCTLRLGPRRRPLPVFSSFRERLWRRRRRSDLLFEMPMRQKARLDGSRPGLRSEALRLIAPQLQTNFNRCLPFCPRKCNRDACRLGVAERLLRLAVYLLEDLIKRQGTVENVVPLGF